MTEIWKPCKHYEDKLEISTLGRVRYADTKEPKTQWSSNHGYSKIPYMCIKINGKKEKVHRLVALTFIPNPENKPYVDHIDTVSTNNQVSNLRWVSPSENNNNPLTLQHQREAQSNRPKEFTKPKQVQCIETGEIFESGSSASRALGFRRSAVGDAIRNNKKSGGYHWKYID